MRKIIDAIVKGCGIDDIPNIETISDAANEVARIVRHREVDLEVLTDEIARLAEKKNKISDDIDKKKETLKEILVENDIYEAGRVKIVKTPLSVLIVDEKKLPSEFLRIKTYPDKNKIKSAILDGIKVKGVELTKDSYSIRINDKGLN